MTTVEDTIENDDYDEFGLLHENASEYGMELTDAPVVRRCEWEPPEGQALSYIRWGSASPELVFLHGGGQNAHTWDTVILALGRPAIAVDLPGHGHSARRADRNYGPWENTAAVAPLIAEVAPDASAVVGMSLGGATLFHLAAAHPDLVRRAVAIDVTPQVNDSVRTMAPADRGSVALIAGPPTYDSFEAMADATVALSPYRAASGVRRGVRHNSMRLPDGRWTWRYDLFGPMPEGAADWADFTTLWDDVEAITAPLMFVRGGLSKYTSDDDEAAMRRRCRDLRVEIVDGAGHAVQSDQPAKLVALLEDFVPAGGGSIFG